MAQPDSENRLICPNCQSLNFPYAVICPSCGIKIEDFRAAMPRLQQLKETKAASQREKLENEKVIQIEEETTKGRKTFRKLLLFLTSGIFLAGLIVSVGAILYASRVKQTQEEFKAQYEASLICLENENYLCARDGFQTLIVSGDDFFNLQEYLNQAQFGLAKQYYETGQWEEAVTELDLLLQNDPSNKEAVSLLKISYDRWINQLGIEGKWLKKWMVRRERDARFPPGDE